MQALRLLVLGIAIAAAPAFAQWQWIDKDGRKVFSDSAPPPTVPADKVLRRPGNRPAPAEPLAAASTPAPASSAAAPKVAGKDKALEEKKKQADAEADARKKAQEEEVAKTRAESCQRAKRSKAGFDSGVRITQTNEKGELFVLDDAQRAVEAKRLDGIISRDCAG